MHGKKESGKRLNSAMTRKDILRGNPAIGKGGLVEDDDKFDAMSFGGKGDNIKVIVD